jgi:hypothetical protein
VDGCDLCRTLQSRQNPQDSADHAKNGCWSERSRFGLLEELLWLELFSSAEITRPLQEEAASMISAALGKVVDRLPMWGKVLFYVLTLLVSAYCIAHYGFFHFMLRVIFSP